MGLSDADKQAAAQLAKLAKTREITAEQAIELENYRRAGRIFELLKSKARQALRNGESAIE